MRYAYQYRIKVDVEDYLFENMEREEIYKRYKEDPDELMEWLDEQCWVADSVTGNASGSYTFNREEAKEYVLDNIELCVEALTEFCQLDELGKKISGGDWEWLDVTIRCYLLSSIIGEVLESLEDDPEYKALESEV